jgi:hypothetical protein
MIFPAFFSNPLIFFDGWALDGGGSFFSNMFFLSAILSIYYILFIDLYFVKIVKTYLKKIKTYLGRLAWHQPWRGYAPICENCIVCKY